jgi:hypothetical protein
VAQGVGAVTNPAFSGAALFAGAAPYSPVKGLDFWLQKIAPLETSGLFWKPGISE